KDMKEDVEIVLRSSGVAAAGRQGGQYQDWRNLDLKLDTIQRRLDGDKLDVLDGLEATKSGLEATMNKMMDLLAAGDGVMGRLDFLVAMLMTVRGDKVDTPRHACILPGSYAEPDGLSDELRRPDVWKKKVEDWRESDFEAGKGVWTKKMRLFLVCAQTHQLVPCGHNGRGYDIQRVRKWVRMTVDFAKFALQVTCASLAAVAVAQLPASTLGVGEQAAEAAFGSLPGMLGGVTLRADDDEAAEVLHGEVRLLWVQQERLVGPPLCPLPVLDDFPTEYQIRPFPLHDARFLVHKVVYWYIPSVEEMVMLHRSPALTKVDITPIERRLIFPHPLPILFAPFPPYLKSTKCSREPRTNACGDLCTTWRTLLEWRSVQRRKKRTRNVAPPPARPSSSISTK
ncbi:MAG: hypothetical protein ABJZ75_01165, partial [Luteolibacter sp.]